MTRALLFTCQHFQKWLTTRREIFINYSVLNTSWLSYTDCVLSGLESSLYSSDSKLVVSFFPVKGWMPLDVVGNIVLVGPFLSGLRLSPNVYFRCFCFSPDFFCAARDHQSLLTILVSLALLSHFNLSLLICCRRGIRLANSLELCKVSRVHWAHSPLSKIECVLLCTTWII